VDHRRTELPRGWVDREDRATTRSELHDLLASIYDDICELDAAYDEVIRREHTIEVDQLAEFGKRLGAIRAKLELNRAR
jgi:hypothetical protein